jgi:putative addiction module killer protein
MITKTTKVYDKWFESLSGNIRLKINTYIKRVVSGNYSNCKPVGEGVSEIKIDFQKGYRVFYIISKGIIMILLAGSDKSGNQKKQKEDIQKAKDIKNALKLKGEL